MNWSALGALAELVGAIGVIASLLYLAGQVRHSRRLAQEEAARSVLSKLNAFLDGISRDHGLADVWVRGSRDLSSLKDQAEAVQFSTFLLSIFRTYEEALAYQEAGVQWDWQGLEAQIREFIHEPGVAQWWSARRHWFSRHFQDTMARYQADGGPSVRPIVSVDKVPIEGTRSGQELPPETSA